MHKLRNLVAKVPKHAHEAVGEDYYRIVYSEIRDAAPPNEVTVLRVFSGLWVSGRRRIRGYGDTGGTQEAAA